MRVSPQVNRDALQSAIHAALVNLSRTGSSTDSPIGDLLLVQERCTAYGAGRKRVGPSQAASDLLQLAIKELSEQDSNGAKVLQARFVEGKITRQVAAEMYASPDQVNRWQRAAIANLAQIIAGRELACRETRMSMLTAALPVSSPAQLVGCEAAIAQIRTKLLDDSKHYIIALTGIGGIGKTTLADAIVREVIPTFAFDEIIWLQAGMNHSGDTASIIRRSCEQLLNSLAEDLGIRPVSGETGSEQIGRLRQALSSQSYLVIIDNLETEDQAIAILNEIEKFVEPSKFLITTRARPIVSSPVFYFSLEELSSDNAAKLLGQHAHTIGIPALAEAGERVFSEIYQITGGNPLALKLVVGLASALPIDQILSGLEKSRPGPIEDLYRYIYWQAWRTLTPEAQDLLQAMPLIAETGGLPEQVQAMSGLADDDFWSAIRTLFSRSLLEVSGDVQKRRYSIHRLTETFLRTEIIKWPQMPAESR